jgi:hypothetical protein
MKKLLFLAFATVAAIMISGCEQSSPVAPQSSAISKILNGDTSSSSFWSPTLGSGAPTMVFLGNGKSSQQSILPPQTKEYAHITIVLRKLTWNSSAEAVFFSVDSMTVTTKRVYFITAQGNPAAAMNDWITGMKNISGSTEGREFSADVTYRSGKTQSVTFTLIGG